MTSLKGFSSRNYAPASTNREISRVPHAHTTHSKTPNLSEAHLTPPHPLPIPVPPVSTQNYSGPCGANALAALISRMQSIGMLGGRKVTAGDFMSDSMSLSSLSVTANSLMQVIAGKTPLNGGTLPIFLPSATTTLAGYKQQLERMGLHNTLEYLSPEQMVDKFVNQNTGRTQPFLVGYMPFGDLRNVQDPSAIYRFDVKAKEANAINALDSSLGPHYAVVLDIKPAYTPQGEGKKLDTEHTLVTIQQSAGAYEWAPQTVNTISLKHLYELSRGVGPASSLLGFSSGSSAIGCLSIEPGENVHPAKSSSVKLTLSSDSGFGASANGMSQIGNNFFTVNPGASFLADLGDRKGSIALLATTKGFDGYYMNSNTSARISANWNGKNNFCDFTTNRLFNFKLPSDCQMKIISYGKDRFGETIRLSFAKGSSAFGVGKTPSGLEFSFESRHIGKELEATVIFPQHGGTPKLFLGVMFTK